MKEEGINSKEKVRRCGIKDGSEYHKKGGTNSKDVVRRRGITDEARSECVVCAVCLCIMWSLCTETQGQAPVYFVVCARCRIARRASTPLVLFDLHNTHAHTHSHSHTHTHTHTHTCTRTHTAISMLICECYSKFGLDAISHLLALLLAV